MKNPVVFEVNEVVKIEMEYGPIVPVSVAVKLWHCARRRVYRWVEKGNVKCWSIWGQKFVALTQPVSLRGKKILLPLAKPE